MNPLNAFRGAAALSTANGSSINNKAMLNNRQVTRRPLHTGEQITVEEVQVVVGNKLGAGVSRTVYSGTNSKTGEKYAVMEFSLEKKIVGSTWLGALLSTPSQKRAYTQHQLGTIQRENEIKKSLYGHKNVDATISGSKEQEKSILVLKPLAEMPFDKYLKKGKATFPKTLELLKGAIEGVQHMHKSGIIHADLKPENLLVNDDTALITDFGHSIPADKKAPQHGDEDYRDPHASKLDEECDVYALLMSINDIFYSEDWKSGNEEQDKTINEFKDFIKESIQGDREDRPNLEKLHSKIEETIKKTEKFDNFPPVGKSTKFIDRDLRDLILFGKSGMRAFWL